VNRRQLERLARQTMRELGLRQPLDVDLLRTRLGERRGKPIEVVASAGLAGYQTFGFTGSHPDADCDVIVYEARTTWAHQMMIILHELAHLICDHPRDVIDHSYRAEFVRQFQEISFETLAEVLGDRPPSGRSWPRLPGLRPKVVRSLYDEAIEWEAETMATILSSWVNGLGGYQPPQPTDELHAILGDVTAW
jgi:hypothetical protein